VKVLGEPTLKNIARELVSHVRKSVMINRTLRESAHAQISVLVRRILRKYGLSAGQAREGHADRFGAGKITLSRLGRNH
jgi:hypothetical protein